MRSALHSLLLAILLAVALGASARAQSGAAPAPAASAAAAAPQLSAAEAQQLLSVLQSPQKREQLVRTLEGLQKVLPAAAPAAAQATSAAAPAASAAATPAKPAAKSAVELQPNSLGADLLTQADHLLGHLDNSMTSAFSTITEYRAMGDWLSAVGNDPTILSIIFSATWRLAVVVLVAFLCEYLVWFFSSRFYRRLGREGAVAEAEARHAIAETPGLPPPVAAEEADEPREEGAEGTESESTEVARVEAADAVAITAPDAVETKPAARPALGRLRPLHGGWPLLRRLPFILAAMAVDALPPLAFLAAATLLLASPVVSDILMRLMIDAVVDAYVLCRLLLVAARGTFCAPSPKLRLLHISNESAAFLAVWCRRIAIVIVVGYSIVQIGGLSGMSLEVQQAIGRVFALAIHLMIVVMVLKRRREVEAWLRGSPGDRGHFWHDLKARLASVWHWQAIIIVMLGWVLFATEVTNHVQHPTRLILGTLALLVLFRVLHIVVLGGLEKAFAVNSRYDDPRRALIAQRAARYHMPLRFVINVVLVMALIFFLMQLWGVNLFYWLAVGNLGSRLVSSLGTIGVTLVVAIVIWETLNFLMQIYMDDLAQQGAYVRAARLKTVVPILRNTVLIALFAIFVLTVMSEIGVNIAPLLAGASIIGVALGFGSQKLVQDFINGIFLLLENAMQVGDSVTAGGLSGTVETLSIRTLRLRASDGSVHIIPFSSVTTVTNTNRGLGNAAVTVVISYEEDTDRAAELLKQIVLDLRQEEAFRDGMLSDYQYWGVDRIDGTTATLAGQVVCTDKARWSVQRELNRRIKIAFQKEGIRIMPSASIMAFQHPLDVRVELPEDSRPMPKGRAARLVPPEPDPNAPPPREA